MTAERHAEDRGMLERALEYVQLGYPVFPVCSPKMGTHQHGRSSCNSPGKHPLVSWEPFQTRLPTINEVRSWWDRWPVANIGIPTGALSGVVVLDCDSGEARQLAMNEGGVGETPAVWTGKPGGVHYWFRHPGETVSNFARKRPGLDFRGDGGYVLVPPSRHLSGADYRWVEGTAALTPAPCPPWLMELLHGGSSSSTSSEGEQGEPLDLDAFLDGIPEGGRDDAIWRYACKMRNADVPRQYADQLIRQAARLCRPAFEEVDALEKVARAYRQYEPEQEFTVGSVAPEDSPPVEGAYPTQSFAELLTMQVDTSVCVVDGVIWEGRCHWFFSDPGTGKTMFLLATLMHVAAGRKFCERDTQQKCVLVIEEDSPLSVLADYGNTLIDIYGLPEDIPLRVNKITGLRLVDQHGYDAAIQAVEGCPERPSIVLIDAAERLVPSDRYTTKELDWLTRFVQWCLSEGITVLVIDHTTKAQPKKGETPLLPMARLFGARAKSAISDVMVYFEGSIGKGSIQARFIKFRGEYPPDYLITFDSAEGFGLRSERITARSPAEQEIMRFFNNSPIQDYQTGDVETATGLKRRTVQRVLGILVKRGWLLESGSTSTHAYRRNPASAGVFG
jgi:hypothetical protein